LIAGSGARTGAELLEARAPRRGLGGEVHAREESLEQQFLDLLVRHYPPSTAPPIKPRAAGRRRFTANPLGWPGGRGSGFLHVPARADEGPHCRASSLPPGAALLDRGGRGARSRFVAAEDSGCSPTATRWKRTLPLAGGSDADQGEVAVSPPPTVADEDRLAGFDALGPRPAPCAAIPRVERRLRFPRTSTMRPEPERAGSRLHGQLARDPLVERGRGRSQHHVPAPTAGAPGGAWSQAPQTWAR